MKIENPYDWTHHSPQRMLIRDEPLTPLLQQLRTGNGCVLIGGRGMGKSVLLHQIASRFSEEPSIKTIRFRAPPIHATIDSCLQVLATQLGLPVPAPLDAGEMLDRFFSAQPAYSHCVLLYDELDQYAVPKGKESLGRALFNHLEAVRKDSKRLGILAAGGLGIYVLRDYLGSAFMTRVYYTTPAPFAETELEELSGAFQERGAALPTDVLKAVHLASGGNPALATYGLQRLWERSEITERDVAEIYADFRDKYPDFLRSIRESVAHPDFSEVPLRVWALIQQSGPRVSRRDILEACSKDMGVLRLDVEDVLRLLRSAGLVMQEGSSNADPVELRALASILNLPEPSIPRASLREQLVSDLMAILTRIHAWAPDLFQTGKDKKGQKVIATEAIFSAILGIALQFLGWDAERESLQGAGRTDLKLRRSGGHAIVEVKIWGRNDYREIHQQVEGYWVEGISAGAAVMITDREITSFAGAYRRECLCHPDFVISEQSCMPPIQGHFLVRSQTPDGFHASVDHLLIRVPRS